MLALRPEYEISMRVGVEYGKSVCVVILQDPPEEFVLAMVPYLKGDPGDAASQFIHTQDVASDTWTVNHNKGYRPTTHVYSPGWVEIDAQVIHVSDNQLTVSFNAASTGFVICD